MIHCDAPSGTLTSASHRRVAEVLMLATLIYGIQPRSKIGAGWISFRLDGSYLVEDKRASPYFSLLMVL